MQLKELYPNGSKFLYHLIKFPKKNGDVFNSNQFMKQEENLTRSNELKQKRNNKPHYMQQTSSSVAKQQSNPSDSTQTKT